MPDFTPASLKGHDAVEKALKSGGGGFKPWAPQITWSDGEEKHILIITPASEFYTVDLHEFVPVGTGKKANGDEYEKKEVFISRHSLGEDYDKISDDLDWDPRRRTLAVAVELEPEFENVRGRQRVSGLSVKTEQFTRKDEDGNEQEVEAPIIGMLVQAQKNFFGWLISYDRTKGPVEETPFSVVRRGSGSDTDYDIVPFANEDIDLSGLFDNLDGIAYLRDEVDDISKQVGEAEDDFEAATVVGVALLEKRFEELADKDRYDELVGPIDELPEQRFKKNKKKDDKKSSSRGARPKRSSPRGKAKSEDDEAEPEDKDKLARFADLKGEVEAAGK
jgi:hypothetical protein